MNVQVKVNGVDRTGYVISYEREHKICTGIGRLQISFEETVPVTFAPWNSIDIYENSIFQVRYYVSSVDHNHPAATINLDCQDNSKRLVDYFIPDQYTVEEPTYTRYWIEKFLDEAGITYQFDNVGPGQLISNYTSLGLQPAYEQIMTLLQMSGWYFYFDGNGKAIIGDLNKNFSPVDATFDRTDILEIMMKRDDRMLRNRALVLGNYDPFTLHRAKADVTVKTKWNYDSRDIRTMVVSNSNIPNSSSAYGIANTLVKEFARITVEKHLTVHGARSLDLGDVVMVKSTVYFGKGLVTTFGTRLSKDGLVTDLVLDERCPRLLGFFNFGDYVYVGTYGDGIWRKHIKFDHTWHDFSSGLVDMRATDLHINHGVFTAVTASGDMHYTTSDEGPWSHITTPEFLMSSLEDTASGDGFITAPFSGIMARATIVDKEINRIVYGVDTWSGLNMGDYFMTLSGWTTISGLTTLSGITTSGNRGWLLEYHPISGMSTYNSYPISVSGDYNLTVLDVENDGFHDYVSVKTAGEGIPTSDDLYNYGFHYTQPFAGTKDTNAYSIHGIDPDYQTNNTLAGAGTTTGIVNPNALIAIDNHIEGFRKTVTVDKSLNRATKSTFTRVFNVGSNSWDINLSQTSSSSQSEFTGNRIIGIYPDWVADEFTIFYCVDAVLSGDTYKYIIWNATSNTWGSPVTIGTQSIVTSPSIRSTLSKSIVLNGIIYDGRMQVRAPAKIAGQFKSPCYLDFYLFKIPMATKVLLQDYMLNIETADDDGDSNYGYFPAANHANDEGVGVLTGLSRNIFGIFQNGNHVQIIGWTERFESGSPSRSQELIFAGDENGLQINPIWDDTSHRYDTILVNNGCQLTKNTGFIGWTGTGGTDGFTFNGTNIANITGSTLPFYFDPTKIYPIFSDIQDVYIAKDGADFYKCSPALGGTTETITPPSGRTLSKPFSNATGPFGSQIFWRVTTPLTRLILWDFTSFDLNSEFAPSSNPNNSTRGINFGNFFISDPVDYTVATPQVEIDYIDLGEPDWRAASYSVLRRDGTQFEVVQTGPLPIRIDVSNFNPLLTVQSGLGSFESFYIYDSEVLQVSMPDTVTSGLRVEDYRYTLLPGSGEQAVAKLAVYVTENDIYSFDTNTMSGLGILHGDIVGSGGLNRIETSNYAPSGQYIFVTTSGENPLFYQLDPGTLGFVLHDGLPESRATIIRLDDVI